MGAGSVCGPVDLAELYSQNVDFVELPVLPARETYEVKGGFLSASDALKCDRLNAYKYHGTKTTDESDDNKDARVGMAMELQAVSALNLEQELVKQGEKSRTTVHGVAIAGRLDGLLPDGIPLEIKTTNKRGFDIIEENNQASYWHRPQAEVYMRSLRVDKLVFLYLSRDDGRAKQFMVRPNNGLWAAISSSVYRVGLSQAPEDVPRTRKKICTWCPYRSRCWG